MYFFLSIVLLFRSHQLNKQKRTIFSRTYVFISLTQIEHQADFDTTETQLLPLNIKEIKER